MFSLRVKITAALLVTALVSIVIVTVLIQRFTTSEFNDFIEDQQRANFVADMTAYYEVVGSWENLSFVEGRFPIPPPFPERRFEDNEKPPIFPIQFFLFDRDGVIVFPNPEFWNDRPIPELDTQKADPIRVNDEIVGYVMVDSERVGRDKFEESYLRSVNRTLFLAAIGTIGLALILSFVFARSLTIPLREIATAIQSISQGQLEQQVPIRSQDEIGLVAHAVNQMSADLKQSSHLRKQMMADIAHELRTPITVIGGYLASLSEGLLEPSPERFKMMHDESQHLERLIEDLRVLSLADAGELPLNRRLVAASELINLTIGAFSHQAEQSEVVLKCNTEPDLRLLYVDPDRILQVLSNLLNNALRYTAKAGNITLTSYITQDHIRLTVQDTGPGIEPEYLPYIFERFYRIDASRHQVQHESGLGLAIAYSIVEAHGGKIIVDSIVGMGTTFTLIFPNHQIVLESP